MQATSTRYTYAYTDIHRLLGLHVGSWETRELEAASLLCKGEGLFSPVLTNGSKSCQKINPKPTIKYYLMQ